MATGTSSTLHKKGFLVSSIKFLEVLIWENIVQVHLASFVERRLQI